MRKLISWILLLVGSATLLFYTLNYIELKRYEEASLQQARTLFETIASAQKTELVDKEDLSSEEDDTLYKKHTYGEGYGPEEVRKKWMDLSDQTLSDVSTNFATGDVIGLFYVPRLNRELPIVEGTDERELEKGVGHFRDTGYPGQSKQILLSGHRDTVFRDFGELQVGDELRVMMEHGVFTYVIDRMKVVPADATDVIDFSINEEVLTVSTCYPFSFIGWAPERYVIYAYPK